MNNTTYLKPIHDSAKSFYNKATVKEDNKKYILISYQTAILQIDKATKKFKFLTTDKNHLTQTTLRHTKEFIKQFSNDFTPYIKKDFLKMIEGAQ